MILVLDCETNGLPKNYRAPADDLVNWPRAVQVAWATFTPAGHPLTAVAHIIRPDGFEIPPDAAQIHGITMERAIAEGRPLAAVLDELAESASASHTIVAHNASFDGSVLTAEYLRLKRRPPFDLTTMVCTMLASTDFCRLPGGRRGYKWPKLDELFQCLFGDTFEGAHDAGVDVAACAACYFELQKRGILGGGA